MIKWIVITIVSLIILGALGYNLRDIVNGPAVQQNLQYAKEVSVTIWNNFLKKPVVFIWELITKYIIDPILNLLGKKLEGVGKDKVSVRSQDAFFVSSRGFPSV